MKSRKAKPPIGYVRGRKGRWLKDPKPRVRRIVRRIFNTSRKSGSASAVALCQGLVICRVHNSKLGVTYSDRIGPAGAPGRTRVATYRCIPALEHPDVGGCGEVSASFVDRFIEVELLSVLQLPSLDIQDGVPNERRDHEARLRIREAERHQTEQTVKYLEQELADASDAEPRDRKWIRERIEAARVEKETLGAFHRQHPLLSPPGLNDAEREHLRALLGDLPRLWRHPSVTPQQRRAVIRTVITAIHVTPSAREWTLEIEWVDGTRTSHQRLTPHGTREFIAQACRDGHSAREIVDLLNADAAPTVPKRRLTAPPFTEATLHQLFPVLRELQRLKPATTARSDGAPEAPSA